MIVCSVHNFVFMDWQLHLEHRIGWSRKNELKVRLDREKNSIFKLFCWL